MNIYSTKPMVAEPQKGKPLVVARNVRVKYLIGNKREDIQSRTFNMILRRRKKTDFWALKGVDFLGSTGKVVGIIGANGAGKTTFCRVISGLIRPDEGEVIVRGVTTTLLSIGVGFNPELSGRENVLLNGMMLGNSRRDMIELLPQVIEFSGLKDFINQPLKKYSSGMKSRLGFSIAATTEPDIFIIDEALSAGDLEFSKKAGERIQEMVEKSRLAIIITHQVSFVEKYCTDALWLDGGKVIERGEPIKVVNSYRDFVKEKPTNKRIVNIPQTASMHGTTEVVKVNNLGVTFFLTEEKNSNTRKLWRRKKPFWALKDISFVVNEGDILGIIGPNGAGKSTLCRVLCGVLKADRGDVQTQCELTALLSFGVGFNIQLSGMDNIYLNGMMLGIPKRDLKVLYPEIVDFSGIKNFIQEPVKHYSSGMRSRLGFSIATSVKPDVLIIDEALSAGDLFFYEKASAKIQELIRSATSVIVVTHNMSFVKRVCTRALWIDKGVVKFDGHPAEVVKMYMQTTNLDNGHVLTRTTKHRSSSAG